MNIGRISVSRPVDWFIHNGRVNPSGCPFCDLPQERIFLETEQLGIYIHEGHGQLVRSLSELIGRL